MAWRPYHGARMFGAGTPPSLSRVAPARVRVASVAAALVLVVLPQAAAFAHPLGNFTINHYAGIHVGTDRIALDVVIDRAEIPTFTERQRIDTDGDGQVSDAESEAERLVACSGLAGSLSLAVAGRPLDLTVEAAGLSFPQGAGGLSTMRLVCEYEALLPSPLTAGTAVQFADRSSAGRIGWREIVAAGDSVTISGAATAESNPTGRLTSYPTDLLSAPLAVSELTLSASPGGPARPAPCIPDAYALGGPPSSSTPGFGCQPAADRAGQAAGQPAGAPVGQPAGQAAALPRTVATVAGAVPGGVGNEIAGLFQTRDLTPPIIIVSLLTAMSLGAAHALTPGHGKTVMAAYLVGSRGTARHAVALGLTVTIAHTVGVVLLAVVVLSVSRVTPESFNHVAGIVSGLLVVSIGAWLFLRQGLPVIRARLAAGHDRVHDQHAHHHHAQDDPAHDDAHVNAESLHRHGGVEHSHLPSPGASLTWRSLFALGLFGGLVPSINALIILLATLATGRAAYGLVLVIAFGAGMAIVLGGTGLGLVYAGRWMARTRSTSTLGRVVSLAPAITSIVIIVVGVLVTGQAILGAPVL
jgi:nickel/cobalt exporter